MGEVSILAGVEFNPCKAAQLPRPNAAAVVKTNAPFFHVRYEGF